MEKKYPNEYIHIYIGTYFTLIINLIFASYSMRWKFGFQANFQAFWEPSQHASQVFLESLSFEFLPFFTFRFEVIAQWINVLSTKMAWLGDDGDLEIYAIVFVACRFGLFLLKFI